MKKLIFIAICVIGIACLSSCRSTSTTCGLADNSTSETTEQQADLL
ncbi:MAG: hypothetical protein P8P88_03900 [Polaribacter sp.]|nr:hypothetical protein [Polaribacter sp.]